MKTAKLFQNGQSQAVRLPKEFRFQESEVFIRKFGNAVILYPTKNRWDDFFQSFQYFSDDFMTNRDQPKQQDREELF